MSTQGILGDFGRPFFCLLFNVIVPTLRVVMPPGTLCVPLCTPVTQSVTVCIPTQSVGTINCPVGAGLPGIALGQLASM
ncbi:hypothetical protein KSI34_24880, partial [Salmonella enterica subsp. enterica serovar Indiana]|nr:hypothetical protein [Salmonella enterica subsp. enterica serovar Indiana]